MNTLVNSGLIKGNMYPIRNKALTVFFLVLLTACGQPGNNTESSDQPVTPSVKIDLPEIKERGKLIAITGYNATSYFIYRGQPMGYEYELLQRLAEDLGVELEILLVDNLDELFKFLNEGKGDIIAYSLAVTKDRKKLAAFTIPHNEVPQVLIQRKPDNWRKMKRHNIEKTLIRKPSELIGKQVHVRIGSSYFDRLMNLSEEIGGEIDIVPVSGDVSTDELIRMVAEREIDYTVADENIALLGKTYFPILDVKTAISLPQRIAWAVRNNSPKLLEAVNTWIKKEKKTAEYNVIYNKYYKNKRQFTKRVESEYFSLTGGKISPYDDLIQQYSDSLGWDWRLLASQIYQESQFKIDANSWAGARGLMQLMPATARQFGVTNLRDPEQSIKAGVRYLEYLQHLMKETVPDSSERVKFVLGAYNAGENHIMDAIRLTEKYNGDPTRWEGNVAQYLINKSNPKYYNDPVVKYGYCRGEEPVKYVKEILGRYEQYKQFIAL